MNAILLRSTRIALFFPIAVFWHLSSGFAQSAPGFVPPGAAPAKPGPAAPAPQGPAAKPQSSGAPQGTLQDFADRPLPGGPAASDVHAQATGDYPVMDRDQVPLGRIQRAWDRAATAKAPGQEAPGVSRYAWTPASVYKIDTRIFMVTTISLPAWEAAEQIHLGDPTAFQVAQPKGNIIRISSNQPGGDTNLVVVGRSGRLYPFYVRSTGVEAKTVSDFVVYIDARDPEAGDPPVGQIPETDRDRAAEPRIKSGDGPGKGSEKGARARDSTSSSAITSSAVSAIAAAFSTEAGVPSRDVFAADATDWLRPIPFDVNKLRFDDYRMERGGAKDSESIAPDRVFHDGIFTYLYYDKSRMDVVHRPVVHLVVDKIDNPVNTRTAGPHGNILVIEAVGNMTLRNGERVICLKYLGDIHRPAGADRVFEKAAK